MAENKRQLVLDAFAGKEVERVPVGFWFHFLTPETVDYRADKTAAELNVAGHKAFAEKFHPDFVKLMSDGFFNYPSELLKRAKSAADLRAIEPLGADCDWIEKQVDLVKKQRAAIGLGAAKEGIVTIYNIFCAATSFKFAIGFGHNADKKLADFIEQDKDAVRHALDVVSEDLSSLAKRVIDESGADGIYLSVQNIQDERVTKEVYDSVIAPSEHKVLLAAGGRERANVLHICGYEGARNHLEWYKNYPAGVVNWAAAVEGVPLEEGRKIFGGRTAIGGFANTANGVLYSGKKEEVEAETKRILQAAGRRGIVLGADCTVPRDIDLARLEWVREAAR